MKSRRQLSTTISTNIKSVAVDRGIKLDELWTYLKFPNKEVFDDRVVHYKKSFSLIRLHQIAEMLDVPLSRLVEGI